MGQKNKTQNQKQDDFGQGPGAVGCFVHTKKCEDPATEAVVAIRSLCKITPLAMESFVVYNPVRLKFGEGVTDGLASDLLEHGLQKVLVLVGKGSVRRSGLLDRLLEQMRGQGLEVEVFEGIRSNPVYEDADRAVSQAKSMGAQALLAVGGGSVIDTAKAVAAGYYTEHSVWDFYAGGAPKPSRALPLFVVLTLAATGTEMNRATVLQNNATGQKRGWGNELLFPKISYLDPLLTQTVPRDYTAYGVADLMAHALEQYFSPDESPLSDAFALQVLRQAMIYGARAVYNGQDTEARSQVLWLSTVALNGTLIAGKKRGDFGVHAVEHVLSARYDVAHGAGLSVVYPAWIKHFAPRIRAKLEALEDACSGWRATHPDPQIRTAPAVVGEPDLPFVGLLEDFFEHIGTPTRLSQMGIPAEECAPLVAGLHRHNATGNYFEMKEPDWQRLVQLMY
jgi:alcohol dehydrogenase YqhD (iron-dependent ADH family)